MNDATMTLEEWNKKMLTCTKCRLCEGRTQVVPGQGNLQAEIVFIGEGPGATEDIQGIPFCGASGKFLDELLDSIHLSRKDVFITNIVKCRPPKNRDPLPDEIDACRPWLDGQLTRLHPKVLCVLGRHSMGKFLPGKKISIVHGKVFRQHDGVYIVPLYHPAVALYNGSMRDVLKKDFQVLKKIIEGNIKKDDGDLPPPTFAQDELF